MSQKFPINELKIIDKMKKPNSIVSAHANSVRNGAIPPHLRRQFLLNLKGLVRRLKVAIKGRSRKRF